MIISEKYYRHIVGINIKAFRILAFTCFIFFGSGIVQSQDISNQGLENWVGEGMLVHPQGWTSSNDFSSPIGFQGVYFDSTAHEGQLAAKIITTNIGFAGAPYAGFIVNGKMIPSGHHDLDSIHLAGEPFSLRPDALSGYYKYESDALIEDWGHAFVILKRYDSVNQKIDTIAYGENTLLNPSKDYNFFTVELDYYNDLDPDSIVVAFFSTYPNNPISGGRLWIDDIRLEYGTFVKNVTERNEISVFPNPVRDVLYINCNNPEVIDIYNLNGKKLLTVQNCNTIDTSTLSGNIYILKVQSGNGIHFTKFLKI